LFPFDLVFILYYWLLIKFSHAQPNRAMVSPWRGVVFVKDVNILLDDELPNVLNLAATARGAWRVARGAWRVARMMYTRAKELTAIAAWAKSYHMFQ